MPPDPDLFKKLDSKALSTVLKQSRHKQCYYYKLMAFISLSTPTRAITKLLQHFTNLLHWRSERFFRAI